jgi:hypothetical protein
VREVGAQLVVLSCAARSSAHLAEVQAAQLADDNPGLRILVGRPGDSLYQLVELARAEHGG